MHVSWIPTFTGMTRLMDYWGFIIRVGAIAVPV